MTDLEAIKAGIERACFQVSENMTLGEVKAWISGAEYAITLVKEIIDDLERERR